MTTITPLSDAELERQIAHARKEAEQAVRAGNLDQARIQYQHMAGLISMRSDARVERMERARGLR